MRLVADGGGGGVQAGHGDVEGQADPVDRLADRERRIAEADAQAAQAAGANDYLNTKGIIVRAVGGYGLPDCLRITIGTEDQNRAVIDALSEFAAG